MTSLERFLTNHPAENRDGSQTLTKAIWGGIAQEFDALKAQIKIVSADPAVLENISGDMLDEVILRFIGIPRVVNESDETRIKIMYAFFRRSGQLSWATKHAIRGLFMYYFPTTSIYILENAIETSQLTDGDFEAFDVGVKASQFGDWFPSGASIEVEYSQSFHGEKSLKGSGTGSVYQSIAALTGALILSFAYKGAVKVTVQRTSDSKFWNFTTRTWVVSSEKNLSSVAYDLFEAPVFNEADDTLKVTFSVNDTAGSEFHIDDVVFGPKPGYPFIRVLITTEGQSGDYLNAWAGEEDPVPETDYDNATFIEQDFIGGEGGGIPTTYYQTMLDYTKAAGVKAVFEFIGRG